MIGPIVALCLLTVVLSIGLWKLRQDQLTNLRHTVDARAHAQRTGAAKPELQHPVVDLSRCLGCGTCVSACPEEDVLAILHGQAQVVNGAHCVGVAACARECPVGAISVTIADLQERHDVPALEETLEAVGQPGLYLAGEVTAHALIRVAIEHGVQAVQSAQARLEQPATKSGRFDVCIVGAGPAGLAASLEAKRLGLSAVTLDQADEPGGTVAKYPRKKLVLTRPVSMPLVGKLPGTEFSKEELMALWRDVIEREQLRIQTGSTVTSIDSVDDGSWRVETQDGFVDASNVILAVGRRGVPRKLEVPGEELHKVGYSLVDASSFERQNVLVVGGGDSAVEAALGLAESGTNHVTISYRREEFFRIKAKNRDKLDHALSTGLIDVLHKSEVREITSESVVLDVHSEGSTQAVRLPNDEVFILVGGIPPFALLKQAGVSLDPQSRPAVPVPIERGTGLRNAVAVALALCLATLCFALWNADYYLAVASDRPSHPSHESLRSGLGFGLWMGIGGTVMILANLAYLVRRSTRFRFSLGSLELWMTSHVVTGILAFLFATLHASFAPRSTVGGRAFWAVGILLVTGAIGRYFYAWVPRRANGTELQLAEVKSQLATLSERWHRHGQAFSSELRDRVFGLVEARQWQGNFFGRVLALVGVRSDLKAVESELNAAAGKSGMSAPELAEVIAITRQAHRTALTAAHFEDLRAVLATWRYFHRWVAVAMVLLLIIHVVSALLYSAHLFEGIEA